MKSEYKVVYVSNGGNKITKETIVISEDQHDARHQVEVQGNKVSAVIYIKARHDL